MFFSPCALVALLKNGHRTGPASRGSANLRREADDREAIWGKGLEIVQLLQLAVPNLPASFVSFPNDRGILRLPVPFGHVRHGRIPAPGVCSDNAYSPFQKIHRCLTAHPTTGVDVVFIPVA